MPGATMASPRAPAPWARYLDGSRAFQSQTTAAMKTRKLLALLLIGTALLTCGGLFKILHWPGANAQMLVGAIVQTVMLVALALRLGTATGSASLLER